MKWFCNYTTNVIPEGTVFVVNTYNHWTIEDKCPPRETFDALISALENFVENGERLLPPDMLKELEEETGPVAPPDMPGLLTKVENPPVPTIAELCAFNTHNKLGLAAPEIAQLHRFMEANPGVVVAIMRPKASLKRIVSSRKPTKKGKRK